MVDTFSIFGCLQKENFQKHKHFGLQSFKKIKVENAQEKLFRHRILSGLFLVLFNIQLTFVNDELTCTMTGLKPWISGIENDQSTN